MLGRGKTVCGGLGLLVLLATADAQAGSDEQTAAVKIKADSEKKAKDEGVAKLRASFIKKVLALPYVERTYTQLVLNTVKEEKRVLL